MFLILVVWAYRSELIEMLGEIFFLLTADKIEVQYVF